MSKRRLVITAVLAGATQADTARTYGVSQGWISRLMAEHRAHGETAYQPRSRRPKTSPQTTDAATAALVITLRRDLTTQGTDAGPETIAWHLNHHHGITLSRSSIHRILKRAGLITAQPKKRPKSSYIRFQAEQPNETWQSDFTHYRLSTGTDTEIITWLDDHSRAALHISAHHRITSAIVVTTFMATTAEHGRPASTLTDNGMVYTTRLAGGRGGRNALETCLAQWHITQKNSTPGHPTTCGKVERFQQTLKKWLTAQPQQPETIAELQTLLDAFSEYYNKHRPHRSLLHRATPHTAYTTRPKAAPGTLIAAQIHDRVRTDRIDKAGVVTLRHNGKLHHIGIGRTYAGTYVLLLVHGLHIRVIDAATGDILRELTLNPNRDYQPTGKPHGPQRTRPQKIGRAHV